MRVMGPVDAVRPSGSSSVARRDDPPLFRWATGYPGEPGRTQTIENPGSAAAGAYDELRRTREERAHAERCRSQHEAKGQNVAIGWIGADRGRSVFTGKMRIGNDTLITGIVHD